VPLEADPARAPGGRAQAARDHGGQRDNRIDLYYSTGWQHPTILHSVQGADWDRTPLQQVQPRITPSSDLQVIQTTFETDLKLVFCMLGHM